MHLPRPDEQDWLIEQLARGKGWYKCATCGEILHAPVPSACPGCGGTFRARIRSPMDRLAVEEGQE
jgi:hypothetical protein